VKSEVNLYTIPNISALVLGLLPNSSFEGSEQDNRLQTILFESSHANSTARKTCPVCATAQKETGLCTTLPCVSGESSIRMKWHAGFGVEHCLLLNAEAPLPVDRRSLRNRQIFFIKKAILQCINHPNCCYAGLCFTSIPPCGAL
jgi:hypothetical protein